ncbi:hypothetical protein [Acidovorax sp.]|uniref:hypothetical protein n=1 Tax=Acidovorax sp. TaxID=1872122 RepID=UPI00391EFD6D
MRASPRTICAAIAAATLSLSASAGLDIDLTNSGYQTEATDTFTVKRLKVPGAGEWDVTFKWDPQSLHFVPQAVAASTAAQLQISGPTTVSEGGSITLAAAVRNADGSTSPTVAVWSVAPASAGTISPQGVFLAASQTADVNAVFTASVLLQGKTITSTYTVKVINVAATQRTCAGQLANNANGMLLADFRVNPETQKVNMLLTAASDNPNFLSSSFFFVQGSTSVAVSLYTFDAGTALFTPSGGWSGIGTIASPTQKEAVFSAFPSSINLTQPFQIRYAGIAGIAGAPATIACN